MSPSAIFRRAVPAAVLCAMTWGAHAAPTPISVVPPLDAGFEVEWALASSAPHSIADALAVLGGSGPKATNYMSTINLTDASVPFGGSDPRFAVRVTGYITLDAGTYSFYATHDDGVKLTIGGDDVIVFDADTAATTTTSSSYTLAAGVYGFEAVSWEQGGAFVLSIGADHDGRRALLAGQHATDVPEPTSLALAGLGLLAAGAIRRRRT